MGDGAKPTLSDVLTKISASALMRNRAVNAHFGEDGIKRSPTANVGIAVAAPQGLVVPVIQRAESLSIPEIADARAELVGALARTSCARATSTAGRSRSRTSACSACSSSSPC